MTKKLFKHNSHASRQCSFVVFVKTSETPCSPDWPRGYKTFIILNSVEHEILNTHKFKNIKKFSFFPDSDKPRMLFLLLTNVKIPAIVGILAFMSRKNFTLN